MRCRKCYISNKVPGVKLNEDKICNLCNEVENKVIRKPIRNFEKIISDKGLNKDYDCIVALSGGKDSTFVLTKLVNKYGLRPLAITIDNGFLSEKSIQNSKNVCEIIGVDYVIHRPSKGKMKEVYKEGLSKKRNNASIKISSDICSSCIRYINDFMLKEALYRRINVIVGGYIAGQVPSGTDTISLDIKTLRLFSGNKNSRELESIVESYSDDYIIHICNPFITESYSETRILEELKKYKWERPIDTGAHSSNCRLNDLGIKLHMEKYGFHPYEFEVTEQVRRGELTYSEAKEKIDAVIDMKQLEIISGEFNA